jgi:hypothetical protein
MAKAGTYLTTDSEYIRFARYNLKFLKCYCDFVTVDLQKFNTQCVDMFTLYLHNKF